MKRLLLPAVMLLIGCGGGESGGAESTGGEETASVAPLGTAAIAGSVNLTGTPPDNPMIDMSEEQACVDAHGATTADPVVVANDGKLANVFVRVVGGLPGGPYPQPTQPAVVDQSGCLYHPRVLGVMVGQDLEIRNSDPMLHNIKAVPTENRGFNISQPRAGMTSTRSFATPEVMVPLECNVHGWMKAYVGVTDNPYFATSGEDGGFSIGGLPAGTYQLEAWHELFGTTTTEVTVAEGETATVDFSFAAGTG